LRALKKTLDPRGILAPGRYDAAPTSAAEPSAPAFLKAGTG
jgi:hypothetical protein